MAMRHSNLDFNTIDRAISYSIAALEHEGTVQPHHLALEELAKKREELKRALSFSLSRVSGN